VQLAQVYIGRNIVLIESVKRNGPGFFTSCYRRDERKLYPKSMLKDCPSIPLVVP
jgi:hypothetical protein